MYNRLGGTKGALPERRFFFSMEKEMKLINWEEDFFVLHRTVSAVKGVEFVNDRMSYIILTGRWCNIIVWNVHNPSEEESDDS